MKAHPALFEGKEGRRGAKKLRNMFQRLRPEEFSSAGDFGLCRNLRYFWLKPPHFSETVLGLGEVERGRKRGRGGENKIGMKFEKKIKFDISGPLLATAQNYLLHSSLPLCSLLLTNCEGSHSVRLSYVLTK